MTILETQRLIVKKLQPEDKSHFTELLTHPKILELIPQKPFTQEQVNTRFNENLNITLEDLNHKKCACGIFEKGNSELIGLALFLLNEEGEKELGYRFRVDYWGKGYGTEITKGMLAYYFDVLNTEKVTADVNVANIGSVKILDKFMTPVREFFNEDDNCTDRSYCIEKKDWVRE